MHITDSWVLGFRMSVIILATFNHSYVLYLSKISQFFLAGLCLFVVFFLNLNSGKFNMNISKSYCLLISRSFFCFLFAQSTSFLAFIYPATGIIAWKTIYERKVRGEFISFAEFLCFRYQDYYILKTVQLFLYTDKTNKQVLGTRCVLSTSLLQILYARLSTCLLHSLLWLQPL